MPVKPSWLNQISFLTRYYISNCEAPAAIYAEKSAPFVGETLLALAGLDTANFIKELFRPEGMSSGRHGSGKTRRRRGAGGIPDPNELAARSIPAEARGADRRYGLPTRVLYLFSDTLDLVGNSIFMLEAISDITYGTMLGVLEWQGEKCPNIARMHRAGGYHVEGGPGQEWEPVSQGPATYVIGMTSPSGSLCYMDAGTYSVTAGMKVRSPSKAIDVEIRMRFAGAGGRTLDTTGRISLSQTDYQDVILDATVEGPCGIVIEGKHYGGFWDVGQSDWLVLQVL